MKTSNWHKRGPASHWPKGTGSTRAYRMARAEALAMHEANGGGCQVRSSPRCTGRAEEWHHLRDRRVYGDDPRYMTWSCRPCNLKQGDPTRLDPEPEPGTRW